MSTTAFYNFTCKISLIVSLWVPLALTFLGNNFHKFKLFSVLNGLSFLCFGGVILGYKTTLIRLKPQYWTIEMNKLITWTQNYQFNCANLLYAEKDLNKLEFVVNEELLKLCEWLNSNKLSLNVSKSNFVIFHP